MAEPRVGSVAEFGFKNRSALFRMRIAGLQPGRRVVWSCLGGTPEWTGTRLTWDLTPKDGGTDLRVMHGAWRSTEGAFARCNSTWGELRYRLKAYAEGKAPGLHFSG